MLHDPNKLHPNTLRVLPEREKLYRMVQQGMTLSELAAEFGTSEVCIRRRLRGMGLKALKAHERELEVAVSMMRPADAVQFLLRYVTNLIQAQESSGETTDVDRIPLRAELSWQERRVLKILASGRIVSAAELQVRVYSGVDQNKYRTNNTTHRQIASIKRALPPHVAHIVTHPKQGWQLLMAPAPAVSSAAVVDDGDEPERSDA